MTHSVGSFLLLFGCVPFLAQGEHARPPGAQAGAAVTGRYRNLFVEAGVPTREVAKKLDAALLGRPGRTKMVGRRRQTASIKPRLVGLEKLTLMDPMAMKGSSR